MPIKFRCQYCQQLLGISQSRAGAVVDCPQCGRDLRVPELDGRTRRMPDARAVNNSDSALISALSELSELGHDHAMPSAVEPSTVEHAAVAQATQQAHVHVEPLEASAPVSVDVEWESTKIESGPVAIYENEGSTAESLAELVSMHSQQSDLVVSDSLLDEMRSVSHPVGVSVASIIGGVFLLLFGLVTGWYFGRAKDGAELSLPSFIQPIGARADNDAPDAQAAVIADGVNVSGHIQYRNRSGQLLPDSGAGVFLLPRDRVGENKLNARSLKLPADHPDRLATLAALSAYGGAFTLTNDDGRFNATAGPGQELVAIAVSRHRERPADLAVSNDVVAVLDAWFDSTSHLCGRLETQMSALDARRPSVEISFGPVP